MNRGERMMLDTMVGKKFGNLVLQKLAYRAEVRETCGPADGKSVWDFSLWYWQGRRTWEKRRRKCRGFGQTAGSVALQVWLRKCMRLSEGKSQGRKDKELRLFPQWDPTEKYAQGNSLCGRNLGTFTAFYEAVQARVKAEKELYDPFIRSFQAQKKKTSGNEIPSCTVGAEKQMEEVLAEWFTKRYVYRQLINVRLSLIHISEPTILTTIS